jgi:hypothetical protein
MRYQHLFDTIDQQWRSLCEAAECDRDPTPKSLPDPNDEAVRQALHGSNSPFIPDESIVNTEFYWDYPTLEALWKLQTVFDRWLLTSPESMPHAVILCDRQRPVDPQIFRRGNPASKGEVVPRQFLSVVAGPDRKPFKQGSGRLEMAQEIIDPANPLTARVWVNRVWSHHFGSGLVTSPSDFGIRSSPPSHPELLDWLTREFITSGWSTKQLHRLIMLSAAYRQGSQGPSNAASFARAQLQDPENRLLWRMNSRRLSFEEFRDSLIANSGEIDLTMGGKGGDLFGLRRGVYATVDRQFLPTVMSVFDLANPDLHSPQRTETTIPQQALFALNHPFVAARAKQVAGRVAKESEASLERRVPLLYQFLFQRDPSKAERELADRYLADAERDSSQPSDAPEVMLTPLEQLTQTLLMSNETMFVD